jgi:hypothetical protein
VATNAQTLRPLSVLGGSAGTSVFVSAVQNGPQNKVFFHEEQRYSNLLFEMVDVFTLKHPTKKYLVPLKLIVRCWTSLYNKNNKEISLFFTQVKRRKSGLV